jgi:hypothetical protein
LFCLNTLSFSHRFCPLFCLYMRGLVYCDDDNTTRLICMRQRRERGNQSIMYLCSGTVGSGPRLLDHRTIDGMEGVAGFVDRPSFVLSTFDSLVSLVFPWGVFFFFLGFRSCSKQALGVSASRVFWTNGWTEGILFCGVKRLVFIGLPACLLPCQARRLVGGWMDDGMDE